MAQLVRFGVSMDAELLAAFDEVIADRGYANRSEAIRDIVRDTIVRADWQGDDKPTVAALCVVYDHHAPDLSRRLASIQHEHTDEIVAALHVHLDAHDCLETIVLRGAPSLLRRLSDQIISTKGVKHGQLLATGAGPRLG